jgi:RNA polymerase primary sigma factor
MEESLRLYLTEVQKVPLLSADGEKALGRAAYAGDAAARQKLIQANLRFVVSVARQLQNRGLPLEDLVNEGNIGLMKAVERFDPERGVRFITYAVWWIRQAMLRALKAQGRLPQVSVSEVLEAGEASLEDFSFLHPDEEFDRKTTRTQIANALHQLPERERRILDQRYGLSARPPSTLAQMGESCHLSRERIRQLEKRALRRLRAAGSVQALAPSSEAAERVRVA